MTPTTAASPRSQADLEKAWHQRFDMSGDRTIIARPNYGSQDDWTIQLGRRKAVLEPGTKQWLWLDRIHNSLAYAGAAVDEAILLVVGSNAGIKRLPEPGDVSRWCVYADGDNLVGPLLFEDLVTGLKNGTVPFSSLIWTPRATDWLSVVQDAGGGFFFQNPAGTRVAL
jgi:hypothetical protein